MHASLIELLENLKPGLLWVARDGVVRYANADAMARCGLSAGKRVFDPELLRAVSASVADRQTRQVSAIGASAGPGKPMRQLQCSIWPGLSHDDAFVLVQPEPQQSDDTGFYNLMQAIRSDLSEPLHRLRDANAGKPVAAASVDADTPPASLDELLTVLDRLVELSSLWTSNSLMANDRIELWPLLQQAWRRVEAQATQRQVRVRFLAQTDAAELATVYGSEHWLGRVFEECLGSAVRAARPGASLEIEHRQLGPRALVVFRDSGVFAGPSARQAGMEMPRSAPATSVRPSLQEQIGLKLCGQVLALHGGHLGEEDVDGLRNFLIELPTGAPQRKDEQYALDVAQAQQYAKDLAALMSRSRRQAKPVEAG
jgi:hypothetical protein